MSDTDHESVSISEAQEVENYLETYKTIAEWIRFADAKAAAVLTVCGVLAGLLIPRLKVYLDASSGMEHPLPGWNVIVMVVFVVWIVTLAASGIMAFRCIIPFRQKGRHPALESASHFHPAAIASHFSIDEVKRFSEQCQQLGNSGFKKEILAAILIDSHISNSKYQSVTYSIKLLAVSAVFAFLFVMVIQF